MFGKFRKPSIVNPLLQGPAPRFPWISDHFNHLHQVASLSRSDLESTGSTSSLSCVRSFENCASPRDPKDPREPQDFGSLQLQPDFLRARHVHLAPQCHNNGKPCVNANIYNYIYIYTPDYSWTCGMLSCHILPYPAIMSLK